MLDGDSPFPTFRGKYLKEWLLGWREQWERELLQGHNPRECWLEATHPDFIRQYYLNVATLECTWRRPERGKLIHMLEAEEQVPCPPTPKRASQHMANPLINPMIASFLDRTDTFQRNAASHKLDKAALNSFHESTNAVMSPQVSSSLSLSNIRPHKLFSKNASDLSQAIRNPMFGASEDDSSPPPTQLEHVPGDEPKRKSLSESIGDAVEKAYTVLRSPTMLPKRLSSTREGHEDGEPHTRTRAMTRFDRMVNIMNQEPPKLKQEEVPVTRLSTLENIALNAREKTGFWRWGFKAKPKIRRGQSSRVRVSQLSSQSKFGGPSTKAKSPGMSCDADSATLNGGNTWSTFEMRDALASVPMLRDLPSSVLSQLGRFVTVERLATGEAVLPDIGDRVEANHSLYIVWEGTVTIMEDWNPVKTLYAKDLLSWSILKEMTHKAEGEVGRLSTMGCSSTSGFVTLLKVESTHFLEALLGNLVRSSDLPPCSVPWDPAASHFRPTGYAPKGTARALSGSDADVIAHLLAVKSLHPVKECSFLEDMLERRMFKAKEIIVKRGDPLTGLWMVVNGHISVMCQTLRLSALKPWSYFGERSLRRGDICTSQVDIQAETAVTCVVLDKDLYDREMSIHRLVSPIDSRSSSGSGSGGGGGSAEGRVDGSPRHSVAEPRYSGGCAEDEDWQGCSLLRKRIKELTRPLCEPKVQALIGQVDGSTLVREHCAAAWEGSAAAGISQCGVEDSSIAIDSKSIVSVSEVHEPLALYVLNATTGVEASGLRKNPFKYSRDAAGDPATPRSSGHLEHPTKSSSTAAGSYFAQVELQHGQTKLGESFTAEKQLSYLNTARASSSSTEGQVGAAAPPSALTPQTSSLPVHPHCRDPLTKPSSESKYPLGSATEIESSTRAPQSLQLCAGRCAEAAQERQHIFLGF
ncbi:hypothetical protein CYMTET_17173 [Cymbomonas tetramitiformis]|uniref:Cyclic nucleotide-binding domain-containing protein n=1 Tax=Cymbomonas tetramitiformis TaxID=36881 RepID=A0AAE0L778_9CHLO|nr:hypothetical protein CYMTET_17173 [Cymbomonas tetramitiformis]